MIVGFSAVFTSVCRAGGRRCGWRLLFGGGCFTVVHGLSSSLLGDSRIVIFGCQGFGQKWEVSPTRVAHGHRHAHTCTGTYGDTVSNTDTTNTHNTTYNAHFLSLTHAHTHTRRGWGVVVEKTWSVEIPRMSNLNMHTIQPWMVKMKFGMYMNKASKRGKWIQEHALNSTSTQSRECIISPWCTYVESSSITQRPRTPAPLGVEFIWKPIVGIPKKRGLIDWWGATTCLCSWYYRKPWLAHIPWRAGV